MPFDIQPSPEIWCRDDFPYLCVWRKLWRAVEVGVDRAEWSTLFLSRWIGHQWWGVDNYEPFPEQAFDREADYQTAVARLLPHAGRTKLLRHSSVEAAKFFPPASVDFVYIDGAHDYESVSTDLAAWFPKLSPHGILAGHDWTDHQVHAGVKPAVIELAKRLDQTVYITAVEGYIREECPSWYLYVNSIPGRGWRRC
jgi:hypothetical protein